MPSAGALTGPNPVDRGKPGSKYHLLVDRQGIPLTVGLSAANTHDSVLLEPMVDAVPAVKGPRGRPGRPRKRPAKLSLDKGYDYARCRGALRRRGITPRIARRGVAPSDRLGRHRWVIERSLAWLVGYRRLQLRYERHADILLGFLHLACALICLKSLRQVADTVREMIQCRCRWPRGRGGDPARRRHAMRRLRQLAFGA